MATVFVLHRVKEYEKWRQVYDSVDELRATGGVLEHAVFRAEGDQNNVLVRHRFSNLQQAHKYFENPELLEAVREAGVDETTTRIEFYDDAS